MVLRRTHTRSIKEIIEESLKESGLGKKLKERSLVAQWEEIVGPGVARSTTSIYIRDRKLFLTIRSSVIRHELMMLRDGILVEINRRAGDSVIDEIVIR